MSAAPPRRRVARPDCAPDQHIIRNAFFRATLNSDVGGRMTSLHHAVHGDLLVPLNDLSFDPRDWPKAGAFPLFPFHNRLHGPGFLHGGRWIQLKPDPAYGGDTMHGPAHRRRWDLVEKGPDFIEMALDYQADEEWPFDFRATQRFHLAENRLEIALSLTNRAPGPMPAGLGWHPYFRLGTGWHFRSDAKQSWDVNGKGGIPRSMNRDGGRPEPLSNFTMTQHLSDWSHAEAIGPARLMLTGSPDLSHLVVHVRKSYFCMEPTTHVAGALATMPEPPASTGLAVLAPGEVLSGRAALTVA